MTGHRHPSIIGDESEVGPGNRFLTTYMYMRTCLVLLGLVLLRVGDHIRRPNHISCVLTLSMLSHGSQDVIVAIPISLKDREYANFRGKGSISESV